MRDFTTKIYKELLKAIDNAGYNVVTFEKYLSIDTFGKKIVILRHDVDRIPKNSLKTALIEDIITILTQNYYSILFNKSI